DDRFTHTPRNFQSRVTLFFLLEKFERNPNQEEPTDELNNWNLKQKSGNRREQNPEYDCGRSSRNDRLSALVRWKPMRCQSDDYGIVSTQHQVDKDNPRNRVEEVHGSISI